MVKNIYVHSCKPCFEVSVDICFVFKSPSNLIFFYKTNYCWKLLHRYERGLTLLGACWYVGGTACVWLLWCFCDLLDLGITCLLSVLCLLCGVGFVVIVDVCMIRACWFCILFGCRFCRGVLLVEFIVVLSLVFCSVLLLATVIV